MEKIGKNYVTVVPVGIETDIDKYTNATTIKDTNLSGYVTVLKIGEELNNKEQHPSDEEMREEHGTVTEEVTVYRLPGERLGFGLKFEGGTKANEFVKKLFIQSCAPNSPASKVESSWGSLIEGDEILHIDGIPISSMTRIECVRALKDSNVAIKLQVRHSLEPVELVSKTKSLEDLPLVISAEKKRNLPPPPPVPPRKVHKNRKNKELNNVSNNGNVQLIEECPQINSNGFSSINSKDDPNYNEIDPPIAEVYVDLFMQEYVPSLSESDDTSSSISTVVDRFGSFPTTTTSSCAGSLPSTPTSSQKRLLDISKVNIIDDEFIIPNVNGNISKLCLTKKNSENKEELYFHDAPLSYGNENIMSFETNDSTPDGAYQQIIHETHNCTAKKPPIAPRFKIGNALKCYAKSGEDVTDTSLPRLVDFVPKPINELEITPELLTVFLNHEIDYSSSNKDKFCHTVVEEEEEDEIVPVISPTPESVKEDKHVSPRRSISEDNNPPSSEEFDETDGLESKSKNGSEDFGTTGSETNQDSVSPPCGSRQPPDGHEFPDFHESFGDKTTDLLQESKTLDINLNKIESLIDVPLRNIDGCSEGDDARSTKTFSCDSDFEDYQPVTNKLHSRSQSLTEFPPALISAPLTNCSKNDKWNKIVEQRKKQLSKLRGLIIPEQSSENDNSIVPSILIPVIKSSDTQNLQIMNQDVPKTTDLYKPKTSVPIYPNLPPWNPLENKNLPKYSPAFKRKSLSLCENTFGNYQKIVNGDEYDSSSKAKTTEIKVTNGAKNIKNSGNFIQKEPTNTTTIETQCEKIEAKVETIPKKSSSPSPETVENKNNDLADRKKILTSAKNSSGVSLNSGYFKMPVTKTSNKENRQTENSEKIEDPMKIKTENKVTESTILSDTKRKINGNGLINGTTNRLESTKKHNSPTEKIEEKVLHNQRPIRLNTRTEPYSYGSKNQKPISVSNLRKTFENSETKSVRNFTTKPVLNHHNTETPKFETTLGEIKKSPIIKNKDETVKYGSDNKKVYLPFKTRTVYLRPEILGGSLGITLAGGIDYENKDITIHRIRYGSVAYKKGSLCRGDRILLINGKPTNGKTHFEAVEMLKERVAEFVLVIEDTDRLQSTKISPQKTTEKDCLSEKQTLPTQENVRTITVIKDDTGLGFSIEGGKGSPKGDVPLLIKKIFKGGAAEKSGELKAGDQVIAINDIDLTKLSRLDAWKTMKDVPNGKTFIYIK